MSSDKTLLVRQARWINEVLAREGPHAQNPDMSPSLNVSIGEPLGHLARLGRRDMEVLGLFNADAELWARVREARQIEQEVLAALSDPERAAVAALRAEIEAKVGHTVQWILVDDYDYPPGLTGIVADALCLEMIVPRLRGALEAAAEVLASPWRIVAALPVAAEWAGPHTLEIEAIIDEATHLDRDQAVLIAAARSTVVGLEEALETVRGRAIVLGERLMRPRAARTERDRVLRALGELDHVAEDVRRGTLVPIERRVAAVHGANLAFRAVRYALVEPLANWDTPFPVEDAAGTAAFDAALAAAYSDLLPIELFDRLSAAWRAGQPAAVRAR